MGHTTNQLSWTLSTTSHECCTLREMQGHCWKKLTGWSICGSDYEVADSNSTLSNISSCTLLTTRSFNSLSIIIVLFLFLFFFLRLKMNLTMTLWMKFSLLTKKIWFYCINRKEIVSLSFSCRHGQPRSSSLFKSTNQHKAALQELPLCPHPMLLQGLSWSLSSA